MFYLYVTGITPIYTQNYQKMKLNKLEKETNKEIIKLIACNILVNNNTDSQYIICQYHENREKKTKEKYVQEYWVLDDRKRQE